MVHGVGATFDDCCLPFAVGVTAHCLVEGHGVPSRELPAAGTEPPLQTRTSCSQAAALGTAGGIEQSGTPSSPASYRPPASQCAKAGEESPARVCVWPAVAVGGGYSFGETGVCYAPSRHPRRGPTINTGLQRGPLRPPGAVKCPAQGAARPGWRCSQLAGQLPGSPRTPWLLEALPVHSGLPLLLRSRLPR